MHNKDLDINNIQDAALEDAQDLGSLDDDPSEINKNKDEKPLYTTEIEYPELDDVETTL
jgi:hypothetical protein